MYDIIDNKIAVKFSALFCSHVQDGIYNFSNVQVAVILIVGNITIHLLYEQYSI